MPSTSTWFNQFAVTIVILEDNRRRAAVLVVIIVVIIRLPSHFGGWGQIVQAADDYGADEHDPKVVKVTEKVKRLEPEPDSPIV